MFIIFIFVTTVVIFIIIGTNIYIFCQSSHRIFSYFLFSYNREKVVLVVIKMENYEEEYIEDSDNEEHVRNTVNRSLINKNKK